MLHYVLFMMFWSKPETRWVIWSINAQHLKCTRRCPRKLFCTLNSSPVPCSWKKRMFALLPLHLMKIRWPPGAFCHPSLAVFAQSLGTAFGLASSAPPPIFSSLPLRPPPPSPPWLVLGVNNSTHISAWHTSARGLPWVASSRAHTCCII